MGKEKRQTKKESEIKREKEEHVGSFTYKQTCIHIHKVIHKKTFYELAFKNTLIYLHTYVYISLF